MRTTRQRWYVLQFPESYCHTPLRWSPGSKLFSMVYMDADCSIAVLSAASLDILYVWLPDMASWPDDRDATAAWAPNGILTAAVRMSRSEPLRPFQLEACWHASLPDPCSTGEARLAKALLAHLSPNEAVTHLAWSSAGSLACVADADADFDADGYRWAIPCTLYVLCPGSPTVAGMEVCWNHYASVAAVVWSPAGDRLLVNSYARMQLVTPACVSVLDLPLSTCAPVFSPDGRLVAAVTKLDNSPQLTLHLISAADGAFMFQSVWEGFVGGSSMAFNDLGDQLRINGLHGARVFTFGQAHRADSMSSKQLSEAITGACS